MDPDVRQAFRDMKEDMRELREDQKSTIVKIDNLTEIMNKHAIKDTEIQTQQDGKLEYLVGKVGRMVEEKAEKKRAWFSLWVGVILASLAGLGSLLKSFFFSEHNKP